MEKIKIRIYPDGIIQMETEGIKGVKCMKYVPLLEKLSNSRVIEQELTDEYYEEENLQSYVQQFIEENLR